MKHAVKLFMLVSLFAFSNVMFGSYDDGREQTIKTSFGVVGIGLAFTIITQNFIPKKNIFTGFKKTIFKKTINYIELHPCISSAALLFASIAFSTYSFLQENKGDEDNLTSQADDVNAAWVNSKLSLPKALINYSKLNCLIFGLLLGTCCSDLL